MGQYYMPGVINVTSPATAVGVKSHELGQGIEAVLEGVGDLHQNSAATISLTPTIGFSSLDLQEMVAFMSQDPTVLTGAALTLLSWDDSTGILASGSVHRKFTAALSSLFPQTLSWQQGQPAEFDAIIQTISSDGSTPAIVASTVGIPTVASLGRMFTLQSVSIGGVVLPKCTSVSINFGLQLTPMRDGGELHCTVALSTARDPVISISSQDSSAITLLAATGAVVLTFVEMNEVGRDAGTVTITSAANHIVPQNSSGQVRAQGSQTIEAKPIGAPGADIFTVAYDSGA